MCPAVTMKRADRKHFQTKEIIWDPSFPFLGKFSGRKFNSIWNFSFQSFKRPELRMKLLDLWWDVVEQKFNTILFADFNATCIDLNISDNCMLLTGYMALYKVTIDQLSR